MGRDSERRTSHTRRAAASVSAHAISAVVSVSTPGVLPTGMPCLVASCHPVQC